ncbi:TonB-dependent receptor [Pseudoduganella ginsengisoli]|uniref:TonB-dependent receptor n=1 Tax=Pseudoduganella ginsengisoli TaxID=1462440 RepID=A0A6L6Q791_9BURK|nr:TonB-dependent receptor [Pseudoduganella ginsengisoli]MTW05319.1 TonB-dependent receptor [Pseudoduganella ginsengisoli]
MLQKNRIHLAILLAFGSAAPALAQDQAVQRVTVTGSSIKRIDGESALPVTVIKAEEFVSKGMTTVEEVLNSVSANQQVTVSSTSIGFDGGGKSSANLRGLGDDRTLVLLNGRRLANHPFDGSSVDLYAIPFAALDRVEVLRDGASHIYGTDAVAGVINFITKRSFNGVSATAEAIAPQQTGGNEKRANVTAGFGNLDKDGYNVFGIIDHHDQSRVRSIDRPYSSTGIQPAYGINKTSGTTFPANFFSAKGITGNPRFASGCFAPDTVPQAGNGVKDMGTCRQDYARLVDDIPDTKQTTAYAKGALRFGEYGLATLDYLHSESENISRIAPPPLTGLKMRADNKWYPGGAGGNPAVSALTGEDLTVNWRPLEAGQRTSTNLALSDRFVLNVEGSAFGWDLTGGASYAKTKVTQDFTGGYVKDALIQPGIDSGTLNPFGLQDAKGAAYLRDALLIGNALTARARNAGIDARATRELMALPGGPLALAIGAEHRTEHSSYTVNHPIVDQASIYRATGLFGVKDKDTSRSLSAFYAELSAPLHKTLELQLAARSDRYSDAGNTFNPKVGIRFQPMKSLMFRGSASTGFRAPSLYELHSPAYDTNTVGAYDDPLLCPNGVAKAGVNPLTACHSVQPGKSGGNPDLQPEKSRSYSYGVVFEPVKDLTASIDYWRIKVTDGIGSSLTEAELFADFDKYRDRFHYNAGGTALDYVNLSSLANLGIRQSSGIDVTMQYRFPATQIGSFDTWFNGTYVTGNVWQTTPDSEPFESIGVYNGATRWKHNFSVRWLDGAWSATLSQRYTSGYTDQNAVAAQYVRDVKPNSVWALSAAYTGFRNMTITAGVKNLLNTDPPFSNQNANPQTGYDPRLSDPIGRAYYARVTYKF